MKRFARKVPSRLLLSVPLVGVLWAVTLPAWAAPLAELQNLLASDAAGEINEFFGIDIALSGDTAVVGAYNDNNANGNRAGAAYVFTRDLMGTWSEEAKLLASDGVAGDDFGHKRPS